MKIRPLLADGSARDLKIFQKLFMAVLLFFVLKNFGTNVGAVEHLVLSKKVGVTEFLPEILFTPGIYIYIYGILIALLVLNFFVISQPLLLGLLLLFYLLSMGIMESHMVPLLSKKFFHAKATCVFPLVALFITAIYVQWKKRAADFDTRMYIFPIQMTHFMIAVIYLGPTVSRLMKNGFPGWYGGDTLQTLLLESSLIFKDSWAFNISQMPTLCLLASVFVLIWEATFWLGIFNRRILIFSLIGAVGFHVGSEILMKVDYVDYFSTLFVCFLCPSYLRIITGKKSEDFRGFEAEG